MQNVVFKIGVVTNNDDYNGGGRVQIRLYPDDKDLRNPADIPWAFPMLPKHNYVVPQIGELCIVFVTMTNHFRGSDSDRFYIGPIISQLDKLDMDKSMSAESFFSDAFKDPDSNPQWRYENNETSDGVYPEFASNIGIGKTTGLLGRDNTDILLKDNELWVRVNRYKKTDKNVKVWSEHPAFIKMKGFINNANNPRENYNYIGGSDVEKSYSSTYQTAAIVVADEIALISSSDNAEKNKNTGKGGNFSEGSGSNGMINNTDMISDEKFKEIFENAHRLPYGDVLIDFLNVFREAFKSHKHNAVQIEPVLSSKVKNLYAYDLNDMLSKTIKIN
jgi:hypothetical protein